MAKAAMIVTISVMCIVILFIIFSYLLTIVNPDIMVTNGTYDRKTHDLHELVNGQADIIYPHDELSAKDNIHFGLEKVPDDYEINTPETERKLNADIGKRFANQKPDLASVVTVKGTITFADHILTTDGKKPVTLIVFPLKDNKRPIREKNIKSVDENPKNVLLKIVDDSGQAKLEVIADSARLIYKEGFNKTKKELDTDDNVYEIRPNKTLLYNVKDQSFKIVDSKAPHINNSLYNSTLQSKYLEDKLGVEKDETDSSLNVTKMTTDTYFLTTNFVSNSLTLKTKLATVNNSIETVSYP